MAQARSAGPELDQWWRKPVSDVEKWVEARFLGNAESKP